MSRRHDEREQRPVGPPDRLHEGAGPDAREDAGTSGHEPPGQDEISALHRSVGNRAVAGYLRGRPMPDGVQARMERAFGRSFGDVRIHTGPDGGRVAGRAGAPAATTGEHVFFGSGRFRPDTPLGEALLAHELAHVALRHSEEDGPSGARLEAEANRATLQALANLHLGSSERIRGRPGHGAHGAGRLLPGSCFGADSTIDAPDYLGPHSMETLERLNSRLESLDMLGPVIAVGTATAVGFGPPSDPSDTVESAAEALASLPAIKKAVIRQEIDFLFLEHGNDLNEQEREFWQRIRDSL